MPATPESKARTRAFARVIGLGSPSLPASSWCACRTWRLGGRLLRKPLFAWFAGALLLFSGLLIIAFHQYWSSVAAVMISLFGWFLALRGLCSCAPQLIERGAAPRWAPWPSCESSSAPSSGRLLSHLCGLDRQEHRKNRS